MKVSHGILASVLFQTTTQVIMTIVIAESSEQEVHIEFWKAVGPWSRPFVDL